MKKIFKKNQIIITALALMIAVAGYLNFSGEDVVNTISETADESTYVDGDELALLDLSDEDIAAAEATQVGNSEELAVADTGEVVSEESNQVGEAVLVSATIGSDFFASARLTREQTRAKNKEMLMEIVDNKNISDAQKEEALGEVVKLTDAAERETATELLLEAKGFEDAVVSIVDDSVDVIVNANELTEQQIAQIEDIVKRKTQVSAENIVISPIGVVQN